jgi:DNA-binding HxlR family transcriptional regulator
MENADRIHNLEPVTKMCGDGEAKPLREFMAKVGDKWTVLVVVMLARFPDNKARFSELQRTINGISQRMLTTTLRHLERDGFVTREVFPEVPQRVEYRLSDLGVSLIDPMRHLASWTGDNWATIKEARKAYDAALFSR